MPTISSSGTLDAVVTEPRFFLDAWVIGDRWRHDRQLDHFGTQPDTVVVLDGAIAKYPDGMVLHEVLRDMIARIEALEDGIHFVATFDLDAFITYWISFDAVIFKTQTPTFLLDSRFAYGDDFTIDAFMLILFEGSWTLDSYFIDSPNGTWETQTATPTGDGVETVFTVAEYAAGTTTVYVNGIPQTSGVVELDPDAGTVQFTSPPAPGAVVTVHARYCV